MAKRNRLKDAYQQTPENEWVQPIRKDYRLCCCDCGLAHTMDFRVYQGRAQFRVRRDNRATAQIRRNMVRRGELKNIRSVKS